MDLLRLQLYVKGSAISKTNIHFNRVNWGTRLSHKYGIMNVDVR
jgi:hypothetical protein